MSKLLLISLLTLTGCDTSTAPAKRLCYEGVQYVQMGVGHTGMSIIFDRQGNVKLCEGVDNG